jgi:multimeric flavodoxin WrbA
VPRASKEQKLSSKKHLKRHCKILLACDAVAFGSADYFSYIAGALKDFFDRTYYPSRAKWPGNHMLRLLQAEEEERQLLQCWIVYVDHSNLGKPLKAWLP